MFHTYQTRMHQLAVSLQAVALTAISIFALIGMLLL